MELHLEGIDFLGAQVLHIEPGTVRSEASPSARGRPMEPAESGQAEHFFGMSIAQFDPSCRGLVREEVVEI